MCFRPATAGAGPVTCPSCGETIFASNGEVLPECPYCGAELPAAPAAPGAPAAPAAPGAPTPPPAPRA
ncbi:MAG: hypothetical protein HFJ75_05855 [Eggerthellaceae bacterium]|nr:hypothetical protein [Eggerthellaceae bacterium]